MTNHPNRKRPMFTVRYGCETAKFSSYRDAMYFAEAQSFTHEGHLIEVGHKSGLVGQYRSGRTTDEFKQHHECRDNV